MFDSDGLRVRRRPGSNNAATVEYTKPVPREQKKIRDVTYAERAVMKRPSFIKPCLLGLEGRGATRGDTMRCFAIACSNAGPYERY
jgi:hypothetical protein